MRALVSYAVHNKAVTYLFLILLVFGGIGSYFAIGQLEDPIFSVKSATIITRYPGASPEEVEQEVTDRLELALQQMPELKDIYSVSKAGESYIKIDIQDKYWSDRLPQVWDNMRKKIADVTPQLPPGVQQPQIGDDFGFVFGFLLALSGDGYTPAEIESYAKLIKKELSLVEDVTRVDLWGVQPKVIYIDVEEQATHDLGLTPQTILNILQNQNLVVNAGWVDVGVDRYRIGLTGDFKSPQEIEDLIIRPNANDLLQRLSDANSDSERQSTLQDWESSRDRVIRIRDVATVSRGYARPSITVLRQNGLPAVGIAAAGSETANIVDVGKRLDERLEELQQFLPLGLKTEKISWQSDAVSQAVNNFMISFGQAVIIVLIVLIIPVGMRMGILIGADLIITILGTFIYLAIMEIPLQRLSLGALIIAMGMMVDNAIVIADGISVRFRRGMNRVDAAIETATENGYPLLAATIIATMAFYPIYGSPGSTGEYCRTLFLVVGASLGLSWLVAMTITPVQCLDMLPKVKKSGQDNEGEDEYSGAFYRKFRGLLGTLIHWRWTAALCLLGLLLFSGYSFRYVTQMFFPDSSRAQIMVDYWAPAGTQIEEVSEGLRRLETRFLDHPDTTSVSSFIGAGPPRFYLPVEPERPFPQYAQLIINFNSYLNIDAFIEQEEQWSKDNVAEALLRFRKYAVGPGNTWPFMARYSGPRDSQLSELRAIGSEVASIVRQSPEAEYARLDMQTPVRRIVPQFDQKKARWSSISRNDVGTSTRRAQDGTRVGVYREGDDLYPIMARAAKDEREDLPGRLQDLQVQAPASIESVPLSQVIDGIEVQWENPYIPRWNRRRAVTVEGAPKLDVTFPKLYGSVIQEINDVQLPPGYKLEWQGEQKSSQEANKQLMPGMLPMVVVIVFLIVTVFNSFRPLFIILMTIPFAVIGITWGLLIFQTPFGFMALLGGMSLAGMMNKNIVVLLDACELNLRQGMSHYDAIIEASVTRIRPVLLAAGTTVLGVIPLLSDVFWTAMAVTIMAGLTFGSLLTLFVVPVFYSILYRVEEPKHG